MPATAGRVRMPANNRVHSSAALQTHGIWQSAIGYDPYAPAADVKGSKPDSSTATATENAYAIYQGLLSFARITNTTAGNETRGGCKKCGRIGHLTYQCRNFLSFRDDGEKKDDSAIQAANAVFEKIKKAASGGKVEESESDDEDEESESSDSDVDPEIERIIAKRFGKPLSKKVETLSSRNKKRSSSSDDDEERKKRRRNSHKKRRRSHHHQRSDSDDDESDSDRDRKHKRRRRRRRESDSDSSSSESSDGNRKRSNRRCKQPHKERRSVLSSESESTASSSDEDERRERREKRRSRGHRRGEKKD